MISKPNLFYEKKLWSVYDFVAGLDEAGRGALAGPVTVGAVILPHAIARRRSVTAESARSQTLQERALIKQLHGVHDSKQLTATKRTQLIPHIKKIALAWAVGFSSAKEIDEVGIVPATRLAMKRALESLSIIPSYLLTDFRLELPESEFPQTAIVKGDQKSLSIASASILAKTARDEMMCELDKEYPQYHFAIHKGYGTLAHRMKIKQLGHSPIHRKTFKIK
jgi:ribonuclease HII